METYQGKPCKRGHSGLRYENRECVECKRGRSQTTYKTPEGKVRAANNYLKRKFGITLAEKQSMIESQEYKCKICFLPINTQSHLDHDHVTGDIRGVLCDRCNRGIGFLQDNSNHCANAAAYLIGSSQP